MAESPLKITVAWQGDKFANLLLKDMEGNAERAGLYLVSSWRNYLNTSQPYKRYEGKKAVYYKGLQPSAPGAVPHKLTGQLQRSITYTLDRKNLILEVGTTMKGYPMALQTGTKWMRPRPWLTLGWDRDKDKVGAILLGGR